ncbi:MAG TPA: alpha/beta hydrolase [Acetobacteraceae bacterium]|nr:alpha/beta hydrolase [Acetobacteraceae bacterium]
MPGASYVLRTSHATIAVSESSGSGPPVLLIHGNSSCKEVFRNQMEGAIGQRYRLIAIDLPGHGKSSDARNPWRSYTMPGYADLGVEVLDTLGIRQFAVLGWSLGGHIGIEMFLRHAGMTGLLATGTPPVANAPDAIATGFRPSEHMALAGKRDLTDSEIDAYAHATCGVNAPFEPFLRDAVRRTDGRARETMFAAFGAGWGADQLHVVETYDRPVAIISGGEEPFVNNDYLQRIRYANLWDGQVHVLPRLGHAPFWEAPEVFAPLFERFLADVL